MNDPDNLFFRFSSFLFAIAAVVSFFLLMMADEFPEVQRNSRAIMAIGFATLLTFVLSKIIENKKEEPENDDW